MARQALGKGLGALIRKTDNTAAQQHQPVQIIADEDHIITAKVKDVVPSPFQPRREFKEEQIAELADSIRERGLLQPLIARRVGDKYELIAGERRLRAVTSLGLEEVKLILMEASDQEVTELALIENIQREDLAPLEEAEQYRRLQTEFNMKQEVIARHVGKSRTVVANMIRLLDLVDNARAYLQAGEITVGHAKVLLQLKDETQQAEAAKRVAEGKLTVRQTEQLVKNIQNPPAHTPGKPTTLPPAYEQVCRQLSSDFGTRVNISLKGKSNGVIEIPYVGRDELVRILQIFGVSAPF